MNFSEKLKLAYQKIKTAKNILLIGHVFPDADAIASLGAMIEIIQSAGVPVYAFADHKPEDIYSFINNEKLISSFEPDDLRIFDVIVILDCGSISRTGLELRLRNLLTDSQKEFLNKRPFIIEFDHHQPQDSYADLEIRDPSKAATTEIIYHFLTVNNLKISKTLASCILIGLATDTGNFLHTNVSKEVLNIASRMLLLGASFPKIINKTVHNNNFFTLKAWGEILEKVKFNQETGLAAVALAEDEVKRLFLADQKLSSLDLFGDIVSFLSYLSGVKIALLLREEQGTIKGSLRTNDENIDVAKIAASWGGGGHKKAAGFAIKGRLKETATGWKVIRKQN